MYNYKLKYEYEEGSDCLEITHKEKYSKEEFEDLVVEATMVVLIDKRPSWTKGMHDKEGEINQEHLDSIGEKKASWHDKHCAYLAFKDILWEVKDVLIEDFGFQKIEYQATFNIYGFQGLVYDNDPMEKENDSLFIKMRKRYKEILAERGK